MIYTPHTWVEISKKAFDHNVSQYKKIIGKKMLAAVVKSNGYGHGLIEIGSMCQNNPSVDWLCVALLSEALQLRHHGIDKPILVMSCIDVDLTEAINKNISFFVSNYDTALYINQIGMEKKHPFNVHIKVDTGLVRFGVQPEAAHDFIIKLRNLAHIAITGIATHCAQAGSKDTTFTLNQLAQFQAVVEQLPSDIPIRHATNSAATGAFNPSYCNLFRVGLGLYGYWPSADNKILVQQQYPDIILQPVLTWKSRIIEIKQVSTCTPIGYEGTFISSRTMKLGYIPIGYYDGYSPSFSNKSVVAIGNSKAPVIGRVAMNVIAIDVTDIPDAHVGQEIILIGDNDGVRASDLALLSELKNERFVLTSINPLVKRVVIP